MSKRSSKESVNSQLLRLLLHQTITLKVNVCCKGCQNKIEKALRKIHGVEDVTFEAEENKVIVTGETDAASLIKKLKKLKKHAVLCDAGASNGEKEEEKAPEENSSSSPPGHGGATQPPTETMMTDEQGYWPQGNMYESHENCSVM
ncbi:heavy metal-associated isoprenylated plant protein 37-like [Zingiber officinale]|uniref:heavy metal-associated isoprenylated plant protein 37-like n=1 Tax=Zingiber officinale TaxID=94328 RepID=UPI001C4D1AC7|nr:heavy metal-associated isoprenylated plant protein 37-like [Zingiber officinale]